MYGPDFSNSDRLAFEDEKIALRRIELFVQVELKREDYVVGVEGLSVGEANAAAEFEYIM